MRPLKHCRSYNEVGETRIHCVPNVLVEFANRELVIDIMMTSCADNDVSINLAVYIKRNNGQSSHLLSHCLFVDHEKDEERLKIYLRMQGSKPAWTVRDKLFSVSVYGLQIDRETTYYDHTVFMENTFSCIRL